MTQWDVSAGLTVRANWKLAAEYEGQVALNSDDLSRMGGSYELTEQERLGMLRLSANLADAMRGVRGLRLQYVEKLAGISQAGAVVIDGFKFNVESNPGSGTFDKSVSFYLPASISNDAGTATATSDQAIERLFTADRLGLSQPDNEYEVFYNSGSALTSGTISVNVGYNTTDLLAEAELVDATTDAGEGVTASNWLLGASIGTGILGYRLKRGFWVEDVSGGAVGADVGYDASGLLDDSSPASAVIGRTARAGTAATFEDGKGHHVFFAGVSYNF